MKKITVLLADDHKLIRKGFRSLLEIGGRVEVVAEAANGLQAVEMVEKHRPMVVLMDIAMPKLNGIEALRQILKARPETRVLMLSAHNDAAYIDTAMALGASGYMLKQSVVQFLTSAILEVEKGNTYFSAGIATRGRAPKRKSPLAVSPLRKKKDTQARASRSRHA